MFNRVAVEAIFKWQKWYQRKLKEREERRNSFIKTMRHMAKEVHGGREISRYWRHRIFYYSLVVIYTIVTSLRFVTTRRRLVICRAIH
jgi:plasmid stabilization system protein ParE